ncbi:MAG: glycosyltransferase family 4 protein [Ornithinimicrobium sp.]
MTPDAPGRVVSLGGLSGPSGGSIYNERIAQQWGTTVECVPGRWPFPDDTDRRALLRVLLHRSAVDPQPVLLDGLVGSAAPEEIRQARAAGVRVVLLVHLPLPLEVGLTASQGHVLSSQERAALRLASAVTCTSPWAARDLRDRYGIREVTVAEPGTDRQIPAMGSRPPQLITPAAYTPRKNHRLLLAAFASPMLAGLPWQALWVGTDPTGRAQEELAADVATAGLQDRVTVGRARQGTDMEEAWAASDLLLLPSVTETYAMVVAEALARGIPGVVGADTAAAETLHGRLPPPLAGAAEIDTTTSSASPGAALATDDPVAWADSIASWLTSSAVREQWRRSAMDRARRLSPWSVPAGILAQLMRAS